MFEILTVCTGNICRSPLAEVTLRHRLAHHRATVASAGTHGLDAAPMTDEAQRLAISWGVAPADAAAHRSRYLSEGDLRSPDLILAMSREHRRRIVDYAPSRLRSTFTVREFARLSAAADDDSIRTAADGGGDAASARLRAAVAAVAAMRGLAAPARSPEEDDVVDPYRRSWDTYLRSGAQLAPALDEVVRVVDLALTTR